MLWQFYLLQERERLFSSMICTLLISHGHLESLHNPSFKFLVDLSLSSVRGHSNQSNPSNDYHNSCCNYSNHSKYCNNSFNHSKARLVLTRCLGLFCLHESRLFLLSPDVGPSSIVVSRRLSSARRLLCFQ